MDPLMKKRLVWVGVAAAMYVAAAYIPDARVGLVGLASLAIGRLLPEPKP